MIQEVMMALQASPKEMFFWKLHSGAELDLFILKDRRRLGFEFKLTHAPAMTPSMRSAIEALDLDHLYLICYGEGKPWRLAEKISAVPAMNIAKTSCFF